MIHTCNKVLIREDTGQNAVSLKVHGALFCSEILRKLACDDKVQLVLSLSNLIVRVAKIIIFKSFEVIVTAVFVTSTA